MILIGNLANFMSFVLWFDFIFCIKPHYFNNYTTFFLQLFSNDTNKLTLIKSGANIQSLLRPYTYVKLKSKPTFCQKTKLDIYIGAIILKQERHIAHLLMSSMMLVLECYFHVVIKPWIMDIILDIILRVI